VVDRYGTVVLLNSGAMVFPLHVANYS